MIVFSVNLVNKNTKNVITNSKGKLSVSAGYESYTSSSIMYSNEPDPFLLMTKWLTPINFQNNKGGDVYFFKSPILQFEGLKIDLFGKNLMKCITYIQDSSKIYAFLTYNI